ncbi:chemotaxis protein CheW [Natronobeatus ordinarius]|uniref:chemotaxis protein CheW n=1 Tax=Natronobeatus ordinarius TaxID=2963433 RepID=UPI0020CCD8AA|nr:chemotaxis protein CheW [Natronobeatus ordinarius]
MSSDIPDRLLGLSIGESDDRHPGDDGDDEQEEYERFVFVELGDHRLALAVDDVKSITDPPTDVTRVPRSSRAIEGVTDLRGVITAVIDLRLHFPTTERTPDDQRLVVFETRADQQPAAVRVDDVLGVESVPERNVLEERELESGSLEEVPFSVEDIDRSVLEHPLLVAAVVKESGTEIGIDDLLPGRAGNAEPKQDTSTDPFGSRLGLGGDASGDEVGELFDDTEPAEQRTETSQPEEVGEVETTGLLDVERLLVASRQR